MSDRDGDRGSDDNKHHARTDGGIILLDEVVLRKLDGDATR